MTTAAKNPRAKRSASVREKETRKKSWRPPALLETPEPPPGYKYRWLRAETLNNPDKGNMSKRLREGFELVSPKELEDSGYDLPVIDEGKHAGVVGIGGLILAKIPLEIVEQRTEYFRGLTEGQLEAVDAELAKSSNPVMPIRKPNRKTQVAFGNPENRLGINDDED